MQEVDGQSDDRVEVESLVVRVSGADQLRLADARVAPGVAHHRRRIRVYSCGGATYRGANIDFQFCKITGKTWSLVIPFGDAFMTARACTLNGPVDPKVKVIPKSDEPDNA